MKRFSIVVFLLFSVFLGKQALLFAQNVDSISLENDTQFLTIFIHGLDQDIDTPLTTFYYSSGTFLKTLKERNEFYPIQTNLFHYRFSDNATHDSNDYIRELGDYNSGTQFITDIAKQQCFISLAKCEWVYRNSLILKAKLNDNSFWMDSKKNDHKGDRIYQEDAMKALLQFGPRFTDFFISDNTVQLTDTERFKYIISKLNRTEISGILPFSESEWVQFAKECYELATGNYLPVANNPADVQFQLASRGRKCPSDIRFVTHSMGSMFISRYVSEAENLFTETNGKHGFYQRNQDYTTAKFQYDFEAMKNRLDISGIKTALRISDDADNTKLKNALEPILREERENTVDKIIIQDAPMAGTPLAADVQNLLGGMHDIFGSRPTWEHAQNDLIAACGV